MNNMETKIWKINKPENSQIKEVARMLKDGKVIAIPTETVYGLGANALDDAAVRRIFEAKGRPNDNPLIVHIATMAQLHSLIGSVDSISNRLIERFWPGPLTIIFKKKARISDFVTAGLSTVAIRMPNHPIALALIKEANIPIAAPSANRSGKPSPTTASHVLHDLNGYIDGIVDSGPTGIGVESTVIDVSGEIPIVLRPGGVTTEELIEVLGRVELDPSILKADDKPISPGMKYKHYAPTGEMEVVIGEDKQVIHYMQKEVMEQKRNNKKVGILTIEEHKDFFGQADKVISFGCKDNLYPYAEHLYEALRIFDDEGINYILAEGVKEEGIGLAIMNRLKKAANGKILSL